MRYVILLHVGMPKIPEIPGTVVESAIDGVTVRWPAVASNTSGPILYLVEGRSVLGRRPDEGQAWSAWTQTAQVRLFLRYYL